MKKSTLLQICLLFIMSNVGFSQNWSVVQSGTNKKLNAISFPSNNVGYIAGSDSLILKTTDGGLNWVPLIMDSFAFFSVNYDIVDIEFVTEDIGFITIGPYAGSYKTIDGGLNWTGVNTINVCFNEGLYFFDENNGFLGGSGCFSGEMINKLSNGVWSPTNINPSFIQSNGIINNFDFYDDSLGIASSSGAHFFRTTDGGTTWDTIPNGLLPNDAMTSVLFVDSLRVLATFLHGQNGGFGVLISQDAGLTWQPDITSFTFDYPSMYSVEKTELEHIYIGGQAQIPTGGIYPGIIYRSDNQMVSWIVDNVAESILDIASHSDSVVFAVGNNGYIIVNQDLSTLSLAQPELNEVVLYPNPSQGDLFIEMGEQLAESIQVFDLKGSLVEVRLFNVDFGSTWRIEGLEKGVYFIEISTQKDVFSKKVVIF